MDRPSSPAGARPFTSGGGHFRPSTAARPTIGAPSTAGRPYTGHDPQYTYSLEEEDEDEDEDSEPEDVFAYLPPTTADLEPAHHAGPAFAAASPFSFAPDPPSPTTSAPFLHHPPPPTAPPLTTSTVADPYYARPTYPPAETPPSTTSQASADDGYRMHRLSVVTQPRTASSREVRVSLPPSTSGHNEKGQRPGLDRDMESQEVTILPKHGDALSSPGGSARGRMMTPSLAGSEGSIKSVTSPRTKTPHLIRFQDGL